jgi:cytochrome P450
LDEKAFADADEVRLDRKPNPHLSFGFGTHLCLGAPHARLILRMLLQKCCEKVGKITVLDAKEHVETTPRYQRASGYDSLTLELVPL